MRRSLTLLAPLALLALSACSGGKDSAADSAADSACDPARYAEVAAEGMPGWTPEAGCEILCDEMPETDEAGRAYTGCFLDPYQMAICQYGEPCP